MFIRLGKLEQSMRGGHIDFLTTHPASEKRSKVSLVIFMLCPNLKLSDCTT